MLPYSRWLNNAATFLRTTSYDDLRSQRKKASALAGILMQWHDLDGTEKNAEADIRAVGAALACLLVSYCDRHPRVAHSGELRAYAEAAATWMTVGRPGERGSPPRIDASGFPRKDSIVPELVCRGILKASANLVGREAWML